MKRFSRIRYPNRSKRRDAYVEAMVKSRGISWLMEYCYRSQMPKIVDSLTTPLMRMITPPPSPSHTARTETPDASPRAPTISDIPDKNE